MKVKIKATGFGTTALRDGVILHFDAAEAKSNTPDMRKLEAVVDIEDAERIKELGWGDFAHPAEAAAKSEGDLAEIQASAPHVGHRPKRPSELKKAAARAAAGKAKPVAAPVAAPAGDAAAAAAGDANGAAAVAAVDAPAQQAEATPNGEKPALDPEAGPAT